MIQKKWMKRLIGFVCILSVAVQGAGCQKATESVEKVKNITVNKENEQKEFDSFLNEMFIEDVQSDSITLNYTLSKPEDYGITDFTPTFGEYGVEASKKEYATAENYYERLNKFTYEALTDEQQLIFDILQDYLKVEPDDEKYLLYGEALGKTTGIQAQLPVLLSEYNFYDKDDISSYLKLLECLPSYFLQIEEYEKQKSEAGLFMSDRNADNIISQCKDFIEDPESNYLITIFNDRMDEFEGLTKKERTDFKKKHKDAIINSVVPAYEHLMETLKSLKGTGKNDGGVCNFKDGKAYYERLAQATTGSDKTVKEMKTALTKTRNKALLKIDSLSKNDSGIFDSFVDMKYPHTDPEETMNYLKDAIKNDFPELEEVNCNIKYVHKSLEEHLSPAFYLTPPIDNYKENSVYINRGGNTNMDEIFPTLAHEGYPGHLFQNVYFSQQNPNPVRSIFNYGGYSEGWATYCELYSYDISGVDANVAEFAKQYNIFNLCLYAEMDIGVNYDGWDLNELKEYLAGYGITSSDAAQEIFDIVVDDPANYLQYVIGYIEFAELRSTAEKELGDKFNAKSFHTFLLDMGPSPFSVIGDYMEEWMKEQ